MTQKDTLWKLQCNKMQESLLDSTSFYLRGFPPFQTYRIMQILGSMLKTWRNHAENHKESLSVSLWYHRDVALSEKTVLVGTLRFWMAFSGIVAKCHAEWHCVKPSSQKMRQPCSSCPMDRNCRKIKLLSGSKPGPNFFSCGHITGGCHVVTPSFLSKSCCDLKMTLR